MTNFTVSGQIIAEAKKFVTAAKEAAESLERLTAAEAGAAGAATKLNSETEKTIAAEKASTTATDAATAATGRKRKASSEAAAGEKEHAQAVGFTKNQLLTLRYTASDVAAQLASGSSPLMILMQQQGPQVAQAFDSPMEALRKMGALLTPMRLLVGGVTAAVVLGVAAHESYAASVREVDIALEAHGNRLGLTTAGYLDLASKIAAAAQVSEKEGRSIVAAMVSAGVASEEALMKAADAARGYGVATGQDAAAAAVELAQRMKDPAKSARDLAEQFNFLDEATLRQIESAQRSGDIQSAQALLADRLGPKFKDMADETSGWARAFEWLGNAASNAWDAVGQFLFGGPEDMASQLDEQIQRAKETIDTMKARAADPGPQDWLGLVPHYDYARELAEWSRRLEGLEAKRTEIRRSAQDKADQEEHDRLSRLLGDVDRRLDPGGARLRQNQDDIDANKRLLDNPKISADERAEAEKRHNALLVQRQQILDDIAKQGETEADKEAAREAKRAAAEAARLAAKQEAARVDIQLQEQIVAARAAGNDELARELEGKRAAAKAGFDLASADGAEMAAMQARSQALEDLLRDMDDVDARLARLDPNITPEANDLALKADLDAAEKWRAAKLATQHLAGEDAAEYGRRVEMVFRDMVGRAYEDDLRRQTDWASGVKVALLDLERDALDFASTTERGLKDMSTSAEDFFVTLAKTGKAEIGDLIDTVEDMFLRLAYQKFLQPGIDNLLGQLVNWGANALLGGSSGGAWGSDGWGGQGFHGGGRVGQDAPAFVRTAPAWIWADAPRHHTGWLAGDEHAAILKNDEGVFTPRQMDNADAILSAALQRPQVNVNIYGAPDGARVEQRENANGDLDIDVMFKQAFRANMDAEAADFARGRSPLNGAGEQAYHWGRAV